MISSLFRRGPAFAGSLLFLLWVPCLLCCNGERDREQATKSLQACITAYWQARVDGKVWSEDTDACCGSIEIKTPDGQTKRIDPVAPEIGIERFKITDIKLNDALSKATAEVWVEYSLPLIPASVTKTITETWERRDDGWRRLPTNINAILVGASNRD